MAIQGQGWFMINNPTYFFITIGRIAGKVKYTLISCDDLNYLHETGYVQIYAVMEVDRNGYGCRIVAMVNNQTEPWQPRPLHEVIWERHRSAIPAGYRVVHLDGETMDNRLDNLELLEASQAGPDRQLTALSQMSAKSGSGSSPTTYRLAMTELLTAPYSPLPVLARLQECSSILDTVNGFAAAASLEAAGGMSLGAHQLYFECHYPPCSRVEQQIKTFSVCGRCQRIRYCSNECQSLDWFLHQTHCQEAKSSLLQLNCDSTVSEEGSMESQLPQHGGPLR